MKNKIIQLRISEDLEKLIQENADYLETTKSDFVRLALIVYLNDAQYNNDRFLDSFWRKSFMFRFLDDCKFFKNKKN